jgi:hypothetical protein
MPTRERISAKLRRRRPRLRVRARRANYVITDAHVLPFLPPANLERDLNEETNLHLIGPCGAEPSVAASCLPIRSPTSPSSSIPSPAMTRFGLCFMILVLWR